MSSGQVSAGYAIGAQAKVLRTPLYNEPKPKRKKKMKLTLKQRFRNWLNSDEELYAKEAETVSLIERDRLEADGMRFNLWKANGGFVIETRYYDRRTDRHDNKMYVVTEEKDLGVELGKIITMESLR